MVSGGDCLAAQCSNFYCESRSIVAAFLCRLDRFISFSPWLTISAGRCASCGSTSRYVIFIHDGLPRGSDKSFNIHGSWLLRLVGDSTAQPSHPQ